MLAHMVILRSQNCSWRWVLSLLMLSSKFLIRLTTNPSLAWLSLQHGASVNAMDLWQFTPLHEAASKNRVEVCSLLLAHGADPTLVNCHSKSALDVAPSRELQERLQCECLLAAFPNEKIMLVNSLLSESLKKFCETLSLSEKALFVLYLELDCWICWLILCECCFESDVLYSFQMSTRVTACWKEPGKQTWQESRNTSRWKPLASSILSLVTQL